MKKLTILVLLLVTQLVAKEIYATFDVVASKDASLAFTAGGIVEQVRVDVGTHVKKGELLASLQNKDIKASLEMARIALKYAKRAYERELKVKHLIDEGKFDMVAKAYEDAKAAYAYKKALYDKTFLRAPFDGVIYEKHIEVGDAVSGMMLKTVFKIQSAHKRKLVLQFDQKYIGDVRKGDLFRYRLDAQKEIRRVRISKVYPYANYANRKVKAEALVSDITPGLFGDGLIVTEE